jgi:hypothetical protein
MGFYPVGLVGAAALSNPVTIAQGGSGKTTAAAAFNVLNPNAAPVTYGPLSPVGTTSQTLVMMGMGVTCVYTPASSGLVLATVKLGYLTQTAVTGVNISPLYGSPSGGAPANGAVSSGTAWGEAGGGTVYNHGATTAPNLYAVSEVLTLTPGTSYWFDVAIATNASADEAVISGVVVSLAELPAG